MRKTAIAAGLLIAGLTWAGRIEARPAESMIVKIPFALTAANRVLPARTYKRELLTKGQPGVDEMEVMVLHGVNVRSYTAIAARLGRSQAQAPVMNFVQQGDSAVLAEVLANGRSFALHSANTDYTDQTGKVRLESVSERTSSPASAIRGQD